LDEESFSSDSHYPAHIIRIAICQSVGRPLPPLSTAMTAVFCWKPYLADIHDQPILAKQFCQGLDHRIGPLA